MNYINYFPLHLCIKCGCEDGISHEEQFLGNEG